MRRESLTRQKSLKRQKPLKRQQSLKRQKSLKKQKSFRRKDVWRKIDIFAPILITLLTTISSMYLMIQARSYTKPMFSFWPLVFIASGEALGVIFELVRFILKGPKCMFRWDRIVNYMFTSLAAFVYGVILQQESIYWIRVWIVTLLPITGGLFQYSRRAWSKMWTDFFATMMIVVVVYRITLIGAVLEFSNYQWGLLLILLPLLYVEMIWVSALCPCWLEFQRSIIKMMKNFIFPSRE